MSNKTVVLILLACVALSVATKPLRQGSLPTNNNVLVLLDDPSVRQTHSVYFADLEAAGFNLDFQRADDPSLSLSEFGEFKYHALVVFAPSVEEFGGVVDVNSIVEFVDAGHNLILAASPQISDPIRELAAELGADFDDEGSYVLDHTNFDLADVDGDHSLIVASDVAALPVITGDRTGASPLLFQGIGHSVSARSKLLMPLVRGSSTAYSHKPETPVTELPTAGTNTALVSVLQARNNARVLISGSIDMFSDKFMRSAVRPATGKDASPRSSNQAFLDNVSRWTLGQRGVLRVQDVKHHRQGESSPPNTYVVKEDIEYSVTIQELRDGKWQPFKADDVQLEFVMLDPYVRTFMQHDAQGRYTAKFQVPDVYGVFKFRLEYYRRGYTHVHVETVHPVRPFRHDAYERFIVAAYPYYASAFSMMGGLVLFSLIFLFTKDKAKKE